jgi:hypothetical protein
MLRVDERSPIEWSRELDAAALGFIPGLVEMSLPAVLRRPTNSAASRDHSVPAPMAGYYLDFTDASNRAGPVRAGRE